MLKNAFGTLPAGREYHRALTIDSTMILVGGQNTVPTPLPFVTTTSDGVTFEAKTALPSGRANAGLAWFKTELWAVGGSDNHGVYSAPMGGAWAIYELLPAFLAACVAIVIVSLATHAPEKAVTDTFDEICGK